MAPRGMMIVTTLQNFNISETQRKTVPYLSTDNMTRDVSETNVKMNCMIKIHLANSRKKYENNLVRRELQKTMGNHDKVQVGMTTPKQRNNINCIIGKQRNTEQPIILELEATMDKPN